MYVTTNSSLVWKRMADENLQSARLMARVCIGLAVLVLAAGAYAFASHSQYSDLCTTLRAKAGHAAAQPARDLGQSIFSAYCS